MKNKISLIIMLILLSSCTIYSNKYKVSDEMNLIRNILGNISRNQFISKTKIIKLSDIYANIKTDVKIEDKNYKYENIKLENGLKFEIFKNNNSDKVIYLLHGGAFYSPIINEYRTFSANLINNLSEKPSIYILEYSTYPNKYPSAHNETFEGYKYLLDLGYKSENIIVFGDSAGGHLAVSLIHRLNENKIKIPKALVLYSPWLDIDNSVSTRKYNINTDILLGNDVNNKELDIEISDPYYFKEVNKDSIYVNPLKGDFSNFPYVYVQAEKTELLLGDTLHLIEKLKKENKKNTVEYDIYYGNFHDFQIIAQITDESKKAISDTINIINKIYGEK